MFLMTTPSTPSLNYSACQWLQSHCLNPVLKFNHSWEEKFHACISVRIAHIVLIPFTLLGNLCHLGVGLCCSAIALLTAGQFPSVTKVAKKQLKQGACFFSDTYAHLLCAINPSANFDAPDKSQNALPMGCMRYRYIVLMINELKDPKNGVWERRAICIKALFSLILANLVDCMAACIMVPISFVFLGSSSAVNGVAYHTICAPIFLFLDIFQCIIYVFNPTSLRNP